MEELMLKRHVGFWLQTHTSAENVGQSRTLLGQSIDYGCTRRSQGCLCNLAAIKVGVQSWRTYLEHVTQDTKHAVKPSVVFPIRAVTGRSLPSDSGHHLGNNHQIDDQRRSQQGILAHVEEADGLMTSHEDFGVILIEGTFVVTHCRHVLDHDRMIRMFSRLIQDGVSLDHVIDNIRFGDFLGTKLSLGTQVHSIVIAEVIIAGNRRQLDAGIYHEVDQRGFHLGLSRLEVISSDEGSMSFRKLDYSWDEGVLRRSIDEGSILQNGCNGEYGGWGDFFMPSLD